MISVFDYTDYRMFLGDFYSEQKKLNPSFSYQALADRAGLKSKTYLHKVITGKKNLAKSSVLKVAKAIKLKYRETEYLNALVDFNNAKTIREKEYYFTKVKELSPAVQGQLVLKSQFELFSNGILLLSENWSRCTISGIISSCLQEPLIRLSLPNRQKRL